MGGMGQRDNVSVWCSNDIVSQPIIVQVTNDDETCRRVSFVITPGHKQ